MFYGQLLFLYQLELRTAAGSRAGNGYIGKGEASDGPGRWRSAVGFDLCLKFELI